MNYLQTSELYKERLGKIAAKVERTKDRFGNSEKTFFTSSWEGFGLVLEAVVLLELFLPKDPSMLVNVFIFFDRITQHRGI